MLGALAALGCSAPAAASAPLDTLRACAEHTSYEVSGLKNLEAACPGLGDALQALGFGATLPDGWQGRLGVGALRDLAALAQRYTAGNPRAAPKISSLAGVLASLARGQAPPTPSLWESLKAWFKHWLEGSDTALAKWLNRALEQLSSRIEMPATLLEMIGYGLSAVVVVAAVVGVLRELRAAGVLRRRRAVGAEHAPTGGAQASDADLAQPPAVDVLSSLLREVVARLLATGRLQAERGLTHRELVVHSRFETETQRAAFARLAGGAESIFYGPKDAVRQPDLQLLAEGRSLLAQIARAADAS
jgi:hypothetical protein